MMRHPQVTILGLTGFGLNDTVLSEVTRIHDLTISSLYSSAVQIGQRLAVIGDEFNRAYEARIPNKMAHIIRESMYVRPCLQAPCGISVCR